MKMAVVWGGGGFGMVGTNFKSLFLREEGLLSLTVVHKLPDAICEECFQSHLKPYMQCVLDLFIICKLVSLSSPKIWYSYGVRSGLYAGWERSLNFRIWIISTVTAAVWFWKLSWCRTSPFVSIPLHWLNSRFHLFKYSVIILCSIDYLSMLLLVLEYGPIKVQKQHKHLPADGTLLNFLAMGYDTIPLHAL